MSVPTRGETAQRRRESADSTSSQRLVRREQIHSALLAIIETTGKSLGEIQLSEIAAGAGPTGISPASVYTYYASKEDILRDAVEARVTASLADFDARFRRTESFGEYISRIVDRVMAMWNDNAALLRSAAGLAASSPEHQRWWQTLFSPWVTEIRVAVEEARTAGEVPTVPGDLEMMVTVSAWAVASSCQQLVTTPELAERQDLVRETLTLTCRRTLGDPC
ncbi:TetR/AcrR family transcriptional regulator [Spiractinospora alimapuensis]|uniref:TetR/AcrR family transcriptional regulator n=1 Tax=Spiractinospora alimapuensis TaxID=2820884 RepID=UPI001F296532|nr:TetR/AcrR family transcriptional regulator [Spiractinospora alimapuensis]QVQ53986.1 TetR/AcrR family transcriptional regulator [Spiractinospora alimapuensis]